MASPFHPLASLHPYRVWDGAVARAVRGERIQLAVLDLDPGIEVPEHSHGNEQVGIVLTGRMLLRVGSDERDLGPGETYVIPPDVPHRAVAGPEGATVIDTFGPPREDWERLERLEPSPGNWP